MNTELPVIEPSSLYPLKTARAMMGWETPSAWAAARRRGISKKIIYFGKRGFLKGSAIIEVVESYGSTRDSEADNDTESTNEKTPVRA